MAKKRKLETVGHPSPPRRNTRAASKSDLGDCGAGGPSQTQRASDAALSPKRVTRASCRDIKGMPDQDVENKRRKKSIIMGDEVKQKSKRKEAMDECHTIKKQPDKVQHTRLLLLHFFIHTPPIFEYLFMSLFLFFSLHTAFFLHFFYVPRLEEKGIS